MPLDMFDHSSPAELYTVCRRRTLSSSAKYRGFDTAAKAIRYSIEERATASLPGAVLEVDGEHFGRDDIRKLSNSSISPLRQKTEKARNAEKA